MVVETTEQVTTERRLSAVTALGRHLLRAESVTDACLAATRALARWPADIRAADIYLRVGDEPALVASNRRTEAAPVPASVLAEVIAGGEIVVLGQEILPDGPAAHAVVPFGRSPTTTPAGCWWRRSTPRSRSTRGSAGSSTWSPPRFGSALDNAVRRDRELGEHRAINETLQAAMITPITDTGTIAARYVAAVDSLSVGGDWYDLVELDDHRRALIVGDCVGHGLAGRHAPWASSAAPRGRCCSRAATRRRCSRASTSSPDRSRVRTAPPSSVRSIDRRTGVITYSRAGHPPPLVSGPIGARWLDDGLSAAAGRASGCPATERRDRHRWREDVLVLYSDGLVERRGEPSSTSASPAWPSRSSGWTTSRSPSSPTASSGRC